MRIRYPTSPGTVRPYRLWNPRAKPAPGPVRWRYYTDLDRAHDAALIALRRWGAVRDVLEVYDARDARFHGAYVRRVGGVGFLPGD